MIKKDQKSIEDKEFFKQKACLLCGRIMRSKKDWHELNPNICLECFEKKREEEMKPKNQEQEEDEEEDETIEPWTPEEDQGDD